MLSYTFADCCINSHHILEFLVCGHRILFDVNIILDFETDERSTLNDGIKDQSDEDEIDAVGDLELMAKS